MKKKLSAFILLIFLFFSPKAYVEGNDEIFTDIFLGNKSAPVKIIIYSSLTCPHCAAFHMDVLPLIKKNYIDQDKVNVTLRDFPLDLAALNASKLIQCAEKNDRLTLLDKIYEKQKSWTEATNINEINNNLIILSNQFNINKNKAEKCFGDDQLEEWVINNRINGQKKYNINSTPTVIINDKKYEGELKFKNIEKIIKKII